MADKDEALHYLLNKLKSDDGWSGSNLAWNVDKLEVIADMFRALEGPAKVKVLISFMSMTPRTVGQVTSYNITLHNMTVCVHFVCLVIYHKIFN